MQDWADIVVPFRTAQWRWYEHVNWTAVIVTALICLTLLAAWVLWLWIGGARIYISEVA